MELLYKQTLEHYARAVERIRTDNTALVDSLATARPQPAGAWGCRACRALIPYIRPDPKASFLSVTPLSLYTRDDPILRYVPGIRTERPAAITWYEGTLVGSQPMCAADAADILFLANPTRSDEEKAAYLQSIGRDAQQPHGAARRMEDLFCAVCCMFDCGMHGATVHRVLRFDEQRGCCCDSTRLQAAMHAPPEALWRALGELCALAGRLGEGHGTRDDTLADALLRDSLLKPCVLSRVLEVGFGRRIPCLGLRRRRLPARRSRPAARRIPDPREFYAPCDHEDTCTRARCGCAGRAVACELACACVACDNMKFCSCAECGDECACYAAHRDCSDLCGCARRPAPAQEDGARQARGDRDVAAAERLCAVRPEAPRCGNRNIQSRAGARVSVCESPRHGYGLFSECFIRRGGFVAEYTGEIISDKEAERRGNFYELNRCSYLFDLVNRDGESLYSVDAYYVGNRSRYINHSRDEANVRSEVFTCGGRAHIVFYSLRDIYRGEELLFDYNFTEAQKREHGIAD